MSRVLNVSDFDFMGRDSAFTGFVASNELGGRFATVVTALNSQIVTGGRTSVNQVVRLSSVAVGCVSHTLMVRIQIGFNADTSMPSFGDGCVLVPKGQTVVIPINATVRLGSVSFIVQGIFDGSLNEVTPSVGSPVTIIGTCLVFGASVPRNMDYLAKDQMFFIGDSITNAATGTTLNKDRWPWQVYKYYRTNGQRVGIDVRGYSGTNSSYHLEKVRDFEYDFPNMSRLFLLLGTNDAAQSVASATYIANMTEIVNYFKDSYPELEIIVLGPTPTDNNTWHSFLEQYRTGLQSLVTSIGLTRVKYINLGTAFDRTDMSFYASSDSVGSKIHLSSTGNAAVSALIWSSLSA